MTDNPKFIHVAAHIFDDLVHAPMMVSGIYNWHRVFEGKFKKFEDVKDTLHEYDIVFMSINALDLNVQLASRIRERIDNSTKLVIAIDYGIELWQGQLNARWLASELQQGDMVFGGEPMICNYCNVLLENKVVVHEMAHPTNVDALAVKRIPIDQRDDEIVAFIHMYDNNWFSPWMVTHDLPWKTTAVMMNHTIEPHMRGWFEYYRRGGHWEEYQNWVATKSVVVDSYHRIHSYGRNAIQCAVMETPSIGTSWVSSQMNLWPRLTTEPDDVTRQRELLKQIMTERSFREDCIAYAASKIGEYNYDERKGKFLKFLNKGAGKRKFIGRTVTTEAIGDKVAV
jgi:hypothetical protein